LITGHFEVNYHILVMQSRQVKLLSVFI